MPCRAHLARAMSLTNSIWRLCDGVESWTGDHFLLSSTRWWLTRWVQWMFYTCFSTAFLLNSRETKSGKWNSRNYSRVLFYHFLSCLFSTSFAYIFRWFSCTSHCQWAQFARITQPQAVKSNKQLEMTGFAGSQLQFRANFFFILSRPLSENPTSQKVNTKRQTNDSDDSRGILNSCAARVWRSPDACSSENLSADWHTRRRCRKAHMKPSVAQCAWLFTPFDEARKREWISGGKSWMRSNWDQRAGPEENRRYVRMNLISKLDGDAGKSKSENTCVNIVQSLFRDLSRSF